MNYLIVGLGNIGAEYHNTRHNYGFMVLDAWAQASNIIFNSERYGSIGTTKFKGRTLTLLKPSTYMNLSGKAVHYWMQKLKIPKENVMILVDDMALPLGSMRIRKKGSDGGHNGLANIAEILGTIDYPRLRLGISEKVGNQVDYVLGKWTPDEMKVVNETIVKVIDACKAFTTIGIDRTMNTYNTK